MNAQTSQTLWLTAPGQLEWHDDFLSPLESGQLLCKTLSTVISPGTEIAAYKGMPPLRPSVVYPRLQGYCNVARVLESRSERFAPGDRVLSFTSHRSRFVLAADQVLVALPQSGDPGHLACAYLYHLGYNAVLRGGIRAGSRVTVIGLGVLGLASIAMARLAGAVVHAISDHRAPRALAVQLGADGVWARSDEDALRQALGAGADTVVTTVNGWEDWQLALRLTSQNGVIACLGFPGRGEPRSEANPLDSQYFYMKQLRIEAVGWSPESDDSRNFLRFNERDNLAWIVSQIMAGRIEPGLLISGRYDAQQINQAYDDLATRKGDPVTYVLDWTA